MQSFNQKMLNKMQSTDKLNINKIKDATFKVSLITGLVLSLMLGGCSSQKLQTMPKKPSINSKIIKPTGKRINSTSDADSLETLLQATERQGIKFDEAEMLKYGNLWERMRAGFLLDLNFQHRRIDEQKGWFITRQKYIDKLTARASYYLYYTVAEAQRRGIPSELALLPIIESSYDPSATSNADAAGMWQFIPSTGKIYGLQQNQYYDGRRDVIESTRAAYDFLTSLYNKFGSWELALAAYNAGPSMVQKAIDSNEAQGYPTDFWSLSLPAETMNYVPRFLAVAKIVNDPQQHGVRLPRIANRPFFRSVPVAEGIHLGQVGIMTDLDMEVLLDLNSSLLQNLVLSGAPKRVLVPATLNNNYDSIIANFDPNNDVAIYTEVSGASNTISQQVDDRLEARQQYEENLSEQRSKFYKSKSRRLPKNAGKLAEFASKAVVPEQTLAYIPVKAMSSQVNNAIDTATKESIANADYEDYQSNAKPDGSSSATVVAETEKQKLQAQVLAEINALPTSSAKVTNRETVVAYPALSVQERANIATELKQTDPTLTQVIDPLDGEIKLEAIQTQQSVLAAQGKKKTLKFNFINGFSHKSFEANKKPKVKPKGLRTVYKVKRGDTLKKIAQRYGLGWRDIAEWNEIDPRASLYVGTPLYLYGAKKIVEQPKRQTSYVVQTGDTMIGLANEFGMSPSELARINGMKALDDLIIGQRLKLVSSGKSQPKRQYNQSQKKTRKQPLQSSRVKTKPTSYRVESGDTMIYVARKFGLSTNKLARLNGMKPMDDLIIGQTLTLVDKGSHAKKSKSDANNKFAKKSSSKTKAKKAKPTSYRVESGDTMIYVARKFGLSTNKLASLNGMKPLDDLIIGQTLVLVDNGKTSSKTKKSSTQASKPKSKTNPTHYTVERGDTMIYIARKFGISTNKLASLNGMKPFDEVRIGQRLKLNGKASSKSSSKSTKNTKTKYVNYKVKSGDGLIQLARRYGISTQKLASINNMKPTDNLLLGQTIKVPNK